MSNRSGNKNHVIKLTGDMKENISQIIFQLNCTCGARPQFLKIMNIYAQKIKKLRAQRNQLKERCYIYEQQIKFLKQKVQVEQRVRKETENDQNIFQILQRQIQTKKTERDLHHLLEQNNNEEQTLLLSQVKKTETEEKTDVPKVRSKSRSGRKSFEDFLEDKMKKRLTHERIKQDLQHLRHIRTPLGDKSNF